MHIHRPSVSATIGSVSEKEKLRNFSQLASLRQHDREDCTHYSECLMRAAQVRALKVRCEECEKYEKDMPNTSAWLKRGGDPNVP